MTTSAATETVYTTKFNRDMYQCKDETEVPYGPRDLAALDGTRITVLTGSTGSIHGIVKELPPDEHYKYARWTVYFRAGKNYANITWSAAQIRYIGFRNGKPYCVSVS